MLFLYFISQKKQTDNKNVQERQGLSRTKIRLSAINIISAVTVIQLLSNAQKGYCSIKWRVDVIIQIELTFRIANSQVSFTIICRSTILCLLTILSHQRMLYI